MTVARAWCLVLALPLLSACFVYRVPGPTLAPSAEVQVRFGALRDVPVFTPAGDLVIVRDVDRLDGRLRDIRGDTLLITAHRWTPPGPARVLSGAPGTAHIVPSRGATVLERHLSLWRSAALLGGIAATMSLGYVLVSIR